MSSIEFSNFIFRLKILYTCIPNFVYFQRNFSHYKERKSDRWKAKVSIAMSISRHWIMQDRSSGLWNFVPHMTPALLRFAICSKCRF